MKYENVVTHHLGLHSGVTHKESHQAQVLANNRLMCVRLTEHILLHPHQGVVKNDNAELKKRVVRNVPLHMKMGENPPPRLRNFKHLKECQSMRHRRLVGGR